MKHLPLIIILGILLGWWKPHAHAQEEFRHYDFLGAGHTNEISVTYSSSVSGTNGMKTVDGFEVSNPEQLKDASRFLAQATFGADMTTIQMTAAMGYEAWLNEQFNLPQGSTFEELREIADTYFEQDIEAGPIGSDMFRAAWMSTNMRSPDILRQRMSFVMSQIFVVNDRSDLFEDHGQMVAQYYDLLGRNSLTNYKTIIKEVTYHPFMGRFLTYFENPKADPDRNIQPDENYAREVMQLFSIGLWELYEDGTRKIDDTGNFIPTYNNDDIDEFAEVFTGLRSGQTPYDNIPDDQITEEIGDRMFVAQLTTPMVMDQTIHDESEKILLNGYTIPAGQAGDRDIDDALTHLSTHPNTAPFISKAIIQFLTTSNPSAQYVRDVASVFDPLVPNNFQEVVKAILLHPEARKPVTELYTFGKLREPVVRHMNLLKAFHISPASERGDYFEFFYDFDESTGQAPLRSPSVFNFFLPDYQPHGPIIQNYFVAPEFQILNSTNSIGQINILNFTVFEHSFFEVPEGEEGEDLGLEESMIDYTKEASLAENPSQLIDHLDILLANGLLTDDTKSIIINAISQLDDEYERIEMAVFLIMVSPDYVVLK